MPAITDSRTMDALLSTSLASYSRTMFDNISKSTPVLNLLMGGDVARKMYERVSTIGERAQFPMLYGINSAQPYSGLDVLDTTPIDGITSSFWTWRDLYTPITISRDEELKNKGEAQIKDLLGSKVMQAEMGIQEAFEKYFLQGNGVNAGNIYDPYQNPANLKYFIDPLPLLVKLDPTTGTLGGIDPSAGNNTWWRNQVSSSTGASYIAILAELRKLRNNCGKGPGGYPDVHIVDQNVAEFYEKALSAAHHNPSYQRADIPFDNVAFYQRPVIWSEFMPNWEDNNTTLVTTKGTWVMVNSRFMGIKVDDTSDFVTTPFEKPVNQQAKTAFVLWGPGAAGVTNRRKHGVLYGIDTTVVV